MTKEIILRTAEIGKYIAATGATVRAAALRFGTSKSTVHKDMSSRLRQIDYPLYLQVAEILAFNRSERHIRGGLATKRKYKVDKIK